jgi:hypothetical protein
MSAGMTSLQGLLLALKRTARAIRLFVGLALTLSCTDCESPTRSKISHQAGRKIHGHNITEKLKTYM